MDRTPKGVRGDRRPVSRVLSMHLHASDGHSSRRAVTRTLQQPTRGSTSCDALSRRAVSHRLFGLAPAGVCLAANVATDAVGSYPTVSPLPLLSQRRFVFCCTVRHMKLTPHVPRRYLATCPVEPGLSSTVPACAFLVATVRPTTYPYRNIAHFRTRSDPGVNARRITVARSLALQSPAECPRTAVSRSHASSA